MGILINFVQLFYGKMNKMIIISAPSGAGKTTLVQHVLSKFSQLEFSISCTTRTARENETDGKDYYFISLKDFKEKINSQQFIEFEEVYQGKFYGTLKSELERIWFKNKVVIFDVDVEGGLNIKKLYPNNSLAIFIAPPSVEELENRLRKRNTDSEATIQVRLKKAEYELNFASSFDKVVVNDELEKAQREIEAILTDYLGV